jgi:carbon starvation protein CstA
MHVYTSIHNNVIVNVILYFFVSSGVPVPYLLTCTKYLVLVRVLIFILVLVTHVLRNS